MEPAQASLVFRARVIAVEEKYLKRWLGGVGLEAKFADEPRGWYIGLEGSYEFLYAGGNKPNVKVGDIATIRISFDAKPI